MSVILDKALLFQEDGVLIKENSNKECIIINICRGHIIYMAKKILLEEDDTNQEVLNLTTMLSALIKGEWDAIDQYNSVLSTLESLDNDLATETLKEIVSEEYIHVGQLEKLAQDINPDAENITTGYEHDELDHEV